METNQTKRKRGRPRRDVAYHMIQVRLPKDLADSLSERLAGLGLGWQKVFELGLDNAAPAWRAMGKEDKRQLKIF